MKTHQLKVWPDYFSAIEADIKTFEVRLDDRNFKIGDNLLLREWSPNSEAYTGRECRRKVDYVMRGGKFGIEAGYVVMAIS